MGIFINVAFTGATYSSREQYNVIDDKTQPVLFTLTGGGFRRGGGGDATFRSGTEKLYIQGFGFKSGSSVSHTFPATGGPWYVEAYGQSSHDNAVKSSRIKFGHPSDAIAPTVTISPNATIVTNASNQNCTKDDPASITVSAVDNSGGVGVKSVTIDGTEYTTASKTVTYTGDQLHTVTASSKDYLDNTSADSTYSFLIDTTAPTVAVSVDSSTGTAVTVGSDEYYNCLLYTSPSPRDQRGWGCPA